jgi:hypothetical protein
MTLQQFEDKHRLKTVRDECNETIISGRFGQIFEYDTEVLGVLFMPDPHGRMKPTTVRWAKHRRDLVAAGCHIRLDGDGEGIATFDPRDAKQAALAIRIAGCRRRRVPTAGQLASLAAGRAWLHRELRP